MLTVIASSPACAAAQTASPPAALPADPSCVQPPRVRSALAPVVPSDHRGAAIIEVRIALDAQSNLVDASIYTSTDPTLNDAALQATRGSSFETKTVDCRPQAAEYRFIVYFNTPDREIAGQAPCRIKNRPAEVLTPKLPITRPFVQQKQYGFHDAQIRVDLDEHSTIVGVTVVSATDPAFGEAATVAAKSTIFATALVNCVPVAQSIVYHVQANVSPR